MYCTIHKTKKSHLPAQPFCRQNPCYLHGGIDPTAQPHSADLGPGPCGFCPGLCRASPCLDPPGLGPGPPCPDHHGHSGGSPAPCPALGPGQSGFAHCQCAVGPDDPCYNTQRQYKDIRNGKQKDINNRKLRTLRINRCHAQTENWILLPITSERSLFCNETPCLLFFVHEGRDNKTLHMGCG